jgi:hypothetical protein
VKSFLGRMRWNGSLVWQLNLPIHHDEEFMPDGRIAALGLERGWSHAIELDPVTTTIVWEWRAPEPTDFFTAGRGSAQRLANGNTLIANSCSGQTFEVTHDGKIIWHFTNFERTEAKRDNSFERFKRLPREYVEALLGSEE